MLTKERGSPPRGLAQETEESLDALRQRFSPSKLVSFVLFNYSQTPLVTLMLSLPRFFLRVWWWVVLAGFHSGRLWRRVTSGQTPRDQEGRPTSWSQRTEVHSLEQKRSVKILNSSFDTEISLIHLVTLQKKPFVIGLNIASIANAIEITMDHRLYRKMDAGSQK